MNLNANSFNNGKFIDQTYLRGVCIDTKLVYLYECYVYIIYVLCLQTWEAKRNYNVVIYCFCVLYIHLTCSWV